ncbi:hypothetical protein DRO48_00265 [Candidatus Bathyarchaeota archaeon]|nr:MAG: hypothetical protein DRO48_00265 [Candidatus Bathyarchaeota archaeon]
MAFLLRKKENPPLEELVNQFLDENSGEVDLAWHLEMEKMPYIPPVVKFMDWMAEKGYNSNYDRKTIEAELLKAVEARVSKRGVK